MAKNKALILHTSAKFCRSDRDVKSGSKTFFSSHFFGFLSKVDKSKSIFSWFAANSIHLFFETI